MSTGNIVKDLLDNKSLQEVQFSLLRNGRVDIEGIPIEGSYSLYEEKDTGTRKYRTEAVKGILTENRLQEVFFSKENIDIIQRLIIYHVKVQSKGTYNITRQSDSNLQVIMRSVYLQYGKNQNNNIVQQVKELNNMVLGYAVPNILSNISQYLYYKKDVSRLPIPIDRPMYISPAGTRTHPDYIFD